MKTIWKFPIQVTDYQKIDMPARAKILCVQIQGGEPYLWAEVDSEEDYVTRLIHVYGTGHAMPQDTGRYIGTFQMMQGRLVFHAYETTQP